MIVPHPRLIILVGIAAPLLGGLAGAFPAAATLAATLSLTLALVAAIDAAIGPGQLRPVTVTVPPITRLSRNRTGAVPITIDDPSHHTRTLRFGLQLPPEIRAAPDQQTVVLAADTPRTTFDWPCTSGRRGAYPIRACYLEHASPLGLWHIRERRELSAEIRVYPNLHQARTQLAAYFLRRGAAGLHGQRMVGSGREFEKLREYIPGDSFQSIHWKTTAKRGRPITKQFQVEHTQEIYVVIDASRLSGRTVAAPESTGDEPLFEQYVTTGLLLGLAAERQGDQFGVIAFSDTVDAFVRARTGKAHFTACRDAIYRLHPRPISPDFDELAAFIRARLRRRALLILLSGLDDPVLAEHFTRAAGLIGNHHLLLVNMLRPPAAQPVFSTPAESPDDLYRHLGGHLRWQDLMRLQRVLRQRGVGFDLLDNEQICLQLVAQYLRVKQRQLL